MIVDIVSAICLLSGGLLALLAAIGVIRLDGVFARMHSATKPATLGLALIMIGTAFLIGTTGGVSKLLTVMVLQYVTATVGAHLLGRAAYARGMLRSDVAVDDLADTALR